ncbi:MAG: zinc metallopeptidase [Clostridia bacterium]|nr:zinc metallopeptidase [Clostridia bacterium]
MFYYELYWLVIPAIILAFYAQSKVKNNYNKYAKIRSTRGLTGAEVASEILRSNGLYDVKIERGKGVLSDHYNPRTRVVTLSPHVYDADSISAASIAAHECGHAVQHAEHYAPMAVRSALVGPTQIATKAAGIFVFAGILLARSNMLWLLDIGILAYLIITVFHLVTLPVEFNASSRAIRMLGDYGLLYDEDIDGTKKVLNAAALTYVAAMLTALLSLIRLLAIRDRRS